MAALQADVSFADDLVSHELPLEQGPEAYKMFQTKRDGAIKIVLRPAA
jgi:threonine dehydrogenase-like Zn-dependent dehydrogenase